MSVRLLDQVIDGVMQLASTHDSCFYRVGNYLLALFCEVCSLSSITGFYSHERLYIATERNYLLESILRADSFAETVCA